MTALASLSNREVLAKTQSLVRDETRLTNEIILHLQEIEKRRCYIEAGFDSLFAYLTKGLGYCESSAYRRMQVARLMRDVPDVKDKIENGDLNLTTAAKVQSFIRAEEKRTQVPLQNTQKAALVKTVQNLSIQKATQELIKALPEAASRIAEKSERLKPIANAKSQVTVTLTNDQVAALERLKQLYSHQLPDPTWGELIAFMAARLIKRDDPMHGTVVPMTQGFCSEQVTASEPVPIGDRVPLLCGVHNRFMAEKYFGAKKMSQYFQRG